MQFEDFNKEPKETDRRWLVFSITLALLMPAYLIFNFLAPQLGFEDRNSQFNNTLQLGDSARWRRVRELCADLPKPEKFDFVNVEGLESVSGSAVAFYYTSTRSLDEIMPTFLLWFNENGWRQIPNTSTFEKGNQTVYISLLPTYNTPNFSYSIYCSEKE